MACSKYGQYLCPWLNTAIPKNRSLFPPTKVPQSLSWPCSRQLASPPPHPPPHPRQHPPCAMATLCRACPVVCRSLGIGFSGNVLSCRGTAEITGNNRINLASSAKICTFGTSCSTSASQRILAGTCYCDGLIMPRHVFEIVACHAADWTVCPGGRTTAANDLDLSLLTNRLATSRKPARCDASKWALRELSERVEICRPSRAVELHTALCELLEMTETKEFLALCVCCSEPRQRKDWFPVVKPPNDNMFQTCLSPWISNCMVWP